MVIFFREYIYPTRDKYFDKSYSPWERFEQISDIDEQVRQNLKALANEQIDVLSKNLCCPSLWSGKAAVMDIVLTLIVRR